VTYSAADLEGAALILLEDARCPSVPDGRGHGPALRSPWGAQAAAAPAQRWLTALETGSSTAR